jgi:transcriptional regulator with XRE-family HTH domain
MPAAGVRRASYALRQRVARNVKAWRRARGWTQAALAAHSGCAANFVSNLECARLNLTLASLETLARALGCCESDLLAQRTSNESDVGPPHSDAP